MIDPIQAAIAKSKGATDAVVSDARNRVSSVRDTVPPLPTVKDPELIKKQVEARAQAEIADQKQKALAIRDTAVTQLNQARSAASGAIAAGKGLSLQALGAQAVSALSTNKIPKLQQISSPKVLAALNVAKKIKELAKERKKISQDNLTKAKEAFKYPIKPIAPEIPQLPRLSRPNIPNLPLNF